MLIKKSGRIRSSQPNPHPPREGVFQQPARLVVWLLFFLISAQALYSVPRLSWELVLGESLFWGPLLSVAVVVGAVYLVVHYGSSVVVGLSHFIRLLEGIPRGWWMLSVIAIGVLLRVSWAIVFPAPLRSDGATYFTLAARLLENGVYQDTRGDFAYWPPGLPFYLYAQFLFLGPKPWVVTLGNLLLFAASITVVYKLACIVADEAVARLSTLLLMLWPNYIAMAGVASKELVLVTLVPAALLLYLTSIRENTDVNGKSGLTALFSGSLTGFMSLTQSSFLLFPGVFVAYGLLCREDARRMLPRILVVILGMALVVGPWMYRNYTIFNEWIGVSTNGGDVFYRANNPKATGGYIPEGEKSLKGFSEVESSKLGYRWGIDWVKEHPLEFIKLGFRKQIIFLGDDSVGVYETLKRGMGISDAYYMILKAVSNGYWFGVWLLALAVVMRHLKGDRMQQPQVLIVMLSFVYLFLIDSVFESGSRHHIPVIGMMAIFSSLLVQQAVPSR